MTYRKKLIEVALPLDAINRESAREKSIRHGHPSTLHLWWARRPLASCRAVIFASLVDDPDEPNAPKAYLEALDKLDRRPNGPDPSTDSGQARRDKLFWFIERLVEWESTTDETLLGKARELINLSCEGKPPPLLDPFCGGGSIPLEGQRLGLEVYASDLNPVAVLITKALVEIPPKFAGKPPVNPEDRAKMGATTAWKGAAGLAADVRHYGKWMRDRAWERIGHLYPKGPDGETIIAWLWARTVRCPNPACGAEMPLVSSFWLSTKGGKEAWVEPIVERGVKVIFAVRTGRPNDEAATKQGSKLSRGANFFCLVCKQPAEDQHIKDEGMASRMGAQLMAVVAEGQRARVYLAPDSVGMSLPAKPGDLHELSAEIADDPRAIWCKLYGLTTFADLFTPRQLVALTTFSDLVGEARELALQHARAAGLPDDGRGIDAGGSGATAYADAIATYLALAVDRSSDRWCSLATWQSSADFIRGTFARQALPMVWDFADANPFCNSTSNWIDAVEWVAECLGRLPEKPKAAHVEQLDAAASVDGLPGSLVATDPPYYDNIGYADLSDFFYVWLRRSLGRMYPSLFATLLVPKAQELVATPYRFGGDRRKAERHFEEGLGKAFALMQRQTEADYPVTLYYAFKQTESGTNGTGAPGWHTMLKGLSDQRFQILGTWPMRTERGGRILDLGMNALASSILIACRPRPADAPQNTFRKFQLELAEELPPALSVMTGRDRQDGSQPWVDPIDLRQAAIGPGMAVYTRYSRVQKADGAALTVPDALQEINEAVDRYFEETEGALDPASRFCVLWYRQNGFSAASFGTAEVLAKAMGTTPEALAGRGTLEARAGEVRLLKPDRYPEASTGPSVWELCHRLVLALQVDGEEAAAHLYNRMPGLSEDARDLAYRLYLEAEKKGRAEDALGYNALVSSWTDIRSAAARLKTETQARLP